MLVVDLALEVSEFEHPSDPILLSSGASCLNRRTSKLHWGIALMEVELLCFV